MIIPLVKKFKNSNQIQKMIRKWTFNDSGRFKRKSAIKSICTFFMFRTRCGYLFSRRSRFYSLQLVV